MRQNASPGKQSEAPRRMWKLGQEQHLGPENQDSQHMLHQPRGSFPDTFAKVSGSRKSINMPEKSWGASGSGTEGGAMFLDFCGSPGPFCHAAKLALSTLKLAAP